MTHYSKCKCQRCDTLRTIDAVLITLTMFAVMILPAVVIGVWRWALSL